MAEDALRNLIEFLEKSAAEVRRLESEGDAVIQTEGQAAFQARLEKKAKLLAALAEKAAPMTKDLEGELRRRVDDRLMRFSTSAATALRIGSVFFMTALLYPEEHRPGEPNDLETFIGELREEG